MLLEEVVDGLRSARADKFGADGEFAQYRVRRPQEAALAGRLESGGQLLGQCGEEGEYSGAIRQHHVAPASAQALKDLLGVGEAGTHCCEDREDLLAIGDGLIGLRGIVVRLDIGDKDGE